MKRLILIRHAKSDWSDLDASDHERRLNARGQQAAQLMSQYLHSQHLCPDHVLCSDAKRTVETLDLLALQNVEQTITRKLYLAEPEQMAAILKRQSEECVMIIGHNPGCAMLAEMLLDKTPDHPQFSRYPTCALLVADFDIETWASLRMNTGTVVDFIVPRDLNA